MSCLVILSRLYKWWGRWHSNLVGCQVAPVDRTVILTCGVYTISIDLGLSLQWQTVSGHRFVILTCGVLLIQR